MKQREKRNYLIHVKDLTALDSYIKIIDRGCIKNLSEANIMEISFRREDILERRLKENLSLEILHGRSLAFYTPDMNLDLDGVIVGSKYRGDKMYSIYLKLPESLPAYFIENLKEMIPFS